MEKDDALNINKITSHISYISYKKLSWIGHRGDLNKMSMLRSHIYLDEIFQQSVINRIRKIIDTQKYL